jgi:hypothetical protein
VLLSYLRIRLTMAAWRGTVRVVRWAALAALLITAAPVTITAGLGYLVAWLRGWPPARLRRTAVWAVRMLVVWLAGLTLQAVHAHDLGWAVPHAGRLAWHDALTGHLARAVVLSLPAAVPVGLVIGSWVWAWRIYAVESGLSGRTASAPAIFDQRQWRRAARAAAARAAAPGAVPLTDRHGRLVIGPTIRTVGHPWHPVLAIPPELLGRHMVIIGSSGAGKTTLMMRLWAGWFTTAWRRFTTGRAARPLLAALDCKGGADARAKADRTRRLLHGAGAQRVAIWPDEATLSLWALPPDSLAVTLFQMIESGDGSAAFYADVLQSSVRLAINAPPGPPTSAAGFLDRLSAPWLEAAYHSQPGPLARVEAAKPHLGAVALRYDTLLARLGPALDGPGRITDADAWYFILEGTREPSVAEAQALALTELIAHAATDRTAPARSILLACDDYSAVSGRVPLWNLYERGRSLGIGVQVSAQSWDGLGADETERRRIVGTADGGTFVLRTPYPEELCLLAGTRPVVETAHKLAGAAWGEDGTSRLQHAWTVNPDIVRSLAPGQAAWIHAGGCTWVQIARPRPGPLAITPTPALPAPPPGQPPAGPAAVPPPPPPGPADLDDAFTPGSRS